MLVESETRLRNQNPNIGGVNVAWERQEVPRDWVRLIARSTGDELVAFDGPRSLIGTLTRVDVVDATPLTLLARWTS